MLSFTLSFHRVESSAQSLTIRYFPVEREKKENNKYKKKKKKNDTPGMIKSGEERNGLSRFGWNSLIVSSSQEYVLALGCLHNLITGSAIQNYKEKNIYL